MSPVHRPPRRLPTHSSALRAAIGLLLVTAALVAVPLAWGAAAPRQGSTQLFLPDLQSEPRPATAAFAAVQAQEGFGSSLVEVQNLTNGATSVQLDLIPKSGTSAAMARRSLGPLGATRLDLDGVQGAEGGFYAGRLSAGEVVGGSAHVRWVSGAAVAYEAAPAAIDLILPLIARTVYSHTTYVFAQNTGTDRTGVTMTLFDAEDGSYLIETSVNLEPDETANWDTAHTSNTFGPGAVGTNAPTGGWLGHAWFQSGQPIAVLAYGDELEGLGSSAYLARPISDAATTQYLPLVRANYRGDSLIAIANATMKAVDVTVAYYGAPFSPGGAGQSFHQEFKIAPRGAVFLDLSTRGRGTRPSPELPRGTGADQGFVGSATISASGPVLAVVQDEQLLAGKVDSVAAYNAFGPGDLGLEFRAVTVRKAKDYQSSVLYVHNPDFQPLDVSINLFDAADGPAGQVDTQVPANGLARIAVNDVSAFPDGIGRAVIQGGGSFTALVGEERDPRGKPDVTSHSVYIRPLAEGYVSGAAKLTERGADLDVVVQISATFPGATYTGEIRLGQCGSATEVAHALTAFTDKKSTTTLRGVSIRSLTATPHVIVVKSSAPRGGTRDVACGTIEPMAGAEVVDTTLSWPVRLIAGEAIATPVATSTAQAQPTDTPTGPVATATNTPIDPSVHLYLPVAHR